jgi:plasmid segregation protein ParM
MMIAIDDGYGEIKAANGTQLRIFPSRAISGRVVRSRFTESGFAVGGAPVLESEGAIFTLQDGANAEDTRFDDWPNSALNRVLCRHAAVEMGMTEGCTLITGLPMSVYFTPDGQVNQKAVRARVDSLHKPVMQHLPDGMTRQLATPGRIKILPQGLAAIFDHILLNPEADAFEAVGVVDIGSRTTDVAVYVINQGESTIEMSRSGGFRRGVSDIVDAMAAELQKSLRLSAQIPLPAAGKALRTGRLKIQGKTYTVESQRLHVLRTLLPSILDEAEHILSAGMGTSGLLDLDRILLVGGGAYLAHSIGLRLWEQGIVPDQPEYANVRGMVKLGQWLNGESEDA